ncbi:MAG: dTMP kinase [Mycoplasmatales bacterium]|nr:dTMP kinase [Mycoplasmatales bacterium]
MFITFEGPDGSGKSTAIKSLSDFLSKEGIDFLLTREPGNPHNQASKKIREIILNNNHKIPDMTEAFLYAADRKMHLDTVILPALSEGKVVLCDRFVDSSMAYQGEGRKLGIDTVRKINEIVIEGKYPDLTIFFDISPEQSKIRVDDRAPKDRLELAGEDFHQRVYQGYLKLIKMFPKRFKVVDATKSRKEVFEDVKNLVVDKIESLKEK